MIAALPGLWRIGSLLSPHPGVIPAQISAVVLIVWARVTFGMRSFHPAANPTAGGLVTHGPYDFIRHPIYASICLFIWARVLGHASLLAISLGALATAGAVARLICKERLLMGHIRNMVRCPA